MAWELSQPLPVHPSHSQNWGRVMLFGENQPGWVAGHSLSGFRLPCCRQGTVTTTWGSYGPRRDGWSLVRLYRRA